jgi:spore coat protein U-like protein
VTPKCAIAAAVWLHLCSTVAAQTPGSCDVSASAVVFHDVNTRENTKTRGTVTVRCDPPSAFALALSPGYGNYNVRRMRGPSGAELEYNLYIDPTYHQVWGDGTPGTWLFEGENSADFDIYGFVPSQRPVRAGIYNDQLTVTLTFP